MSWNGGEYHIVLEMDRLGNLIHEIYLVQIPGVTTDGALYNEKDFSNWNEVTSELDYPQNKSDPARQYSTPRNIFYANKFCTAITK